MRNLNDWRIRAFYLSCVVLVPFLKFLVRNEYGFLYLEVAAAGGMLAGLCVVLGLAARGTAFQVLVALTAALTAAYPAHGLAGSPALVPPWAFAAAIGAGTWFAARRMRGNFFLLLAVFAWSGLLVEAWARPSGPQSRVHAGPARPAHHVLWLILDEQIGLAGLPRDLPECVSAGERIERVLGRYNFTAFPRAYSNYPITTDSVGSILNGRLVRQPGQYMPRAGSGHMRHYAIRRNVLFEEFASRGYRVVGWQHAAMRICGEPSPGVECRDYQEKLKWLHRAPGGWRQRFRWLVGRYQSGDPYLVRVKGFFPFRFGLNLTGPLAVEEIWPDGLAEAVLGAGRQTLFVAHLLTPHAPYLYRRDGTIRPLEEWAGDRADHRVGAAEYRELYCRYCEQVEFVAGQLDRLLSRLEQGGALGDMLVVIHGDHGPRILRSFTPGGEDESVSPELLDFTGEPDGRDLADKFSTLLAVKPAGAARPAVRDEQHSVLTWLSRVVFEREPPDGAGDSDMVYLADGLERLHAIDIRRYWK